MPVLSTNGVNLDYETHGPADGTLVALVMGTGAPGRIWSAHQVPALTEAGFRVVTYDARGVSQLPSQTERSCPDITIGDLVADLAALINHLGGPAHVVGTSMGAQVVQELGLAHPDLVRSIIAMSAHARLDDAQALYTRGERDLFDSNVQLPPAYAAAVDAMMFLSPATLRGDSRQEWLDMLELTAEPMSSGYRAQLEVSAKMGDRREAYRSISRPLLAIGFADDATLPAYLAQELADVVPGASYVEIADAGHFGYLEQPDAVNHAVVEFLNR